MAKTNTPYDDDATATSSTKAGTSKAQGVGDRAREAGDKIAETAQQVRDKVTQQTQAAARATAETLESNPFGAVAGAIAIGAVAAALIPATRRELETLGPVTDRMKELVEEAYHAARAAGSSELTAAGLTAAAATNGFGGVISALIKTATTAAGAAATTMRDKRAATDAPAEGTTGAAGASPGMAGDDMATAQS